MQKYTDVVLDELPDFAHNYLIEMVDDEGEWSNDDNDWPTKWGIRQLIATKYGYTGPLRELLSLIHISEPTRPY